MSLRELIRKDLVACTRETPVTDAAQMMKSQDVGAILVLDEGKPVGIVTDRDIVLRCVCEDADCTLIPVERVMTRSVDTVSVEDGVYDIVEKMKNGEVRRMPIVDTDGRAVGLVSFGDVFELLCDEINKLASVASPEKKKIMKEVA